MVTVPSERDSPLILLVDDHDDGREMYALYLSLRGFRVMTAASGADAIGAVQAEVPALIVMDIGMEGMSGTETLHYLRNHHLCDGVPVIALSGYATDDGRDRALADGFTALILKPCLPDQLVAFIRSTLSASAPV